MKLTKKQYKKLFDHLTEGAVIREMTSGWTGWWIYFKCTGINPGLLKYTTKRKPAKKKWQADLGSLIQAELSRSDSMALEFQKSIEQFFTDNNQIQAKQYLDSIIEMLRDPANRKALLKNLPHGLDTTETNELYQRISDMDCEMDEVYKIREGFGE